VPFLRDYDVVSHPNLKEYGGRLKETLNHVSVGFKHKSHINVMDVKNKHVIMVTFEMTIKACRFHLRISGPRRY
jgi:hypothetical protein